MAEQMHGIWASLVALLLVLFPACGWSSLAYAQALDGGRYLDPSDREIWSKQSRILLSEVGTPRSLRTPGATGRFVAWSDGRIYDPQGNVFIPKGANVGIGQTEDEIGKPYVDCWRFNFVRLIVYTGSKVTQVKRAINAWRARGIVVMPLYWAGQAGAIPPLAQSLEWHADLAATYRDDPYVWLDIGSEPLGRPAVTTVIDGRVEWLQSAIDEWLEYNRTVTKVIRDRGFNGPVIVPSVMWALDLLRGENNQAIFDRPISELSAIAKYGEQLKQGLDNIIFDIHAYDNFAAPDRGRYLQALADELESQGHAFIFGEFNAIDAKSGDPSHLWSARHVMSNTPGRYYGRIVWRFSQGGTTYNRNVALVTDTDTNGGGENINSCTNPTNLTELGKLIWNDTH